MLLQKVVAIVEDIKQVDGMITKLTCDTYINKFAAALI